MPATWRDLPVNDWVTLQAKLRGSLRDAGLYAIQSANATGTLALSGSPTLVTVDTSGGNVTLTLPTPSAVTGHRVEVKKLTAANTLTVSSSANIDGAPTLAWTTQYQSYSLVSTGTTWVIV